MNKFLSFVFLVSLLFAALPAVSAQENSPTISVEDGLIVYNHVIFDVAEMTGPVLSAQVVAANSICLEESNGEVCLGTDLVEFETAQGKFFLWPDYKWITSVQRDEYMWFQSANFEDYSISVSNDFERLVHIYDTEVSFGNFQHDFGRDVWMAEVAPSGNYVVILLPPLEGDFSFDGYFGFGIPGNSQEYVVEVWSYEGEKMYEGNLANNMAENPYGVWLSPEKTDLLQFDSWSIAFGATSPDGRYVAYSDGYLPFLIYENGKELSIFRYAGDVFQPEGSDWWYSEGGWFSAPPAEEMTVMVTFDNEGEILSCNRVTEGYTALEGQCVIEFQGEYSTVVTCQLDAGVTNIQSYFGSFDPTDGYCRQEGAFE